MPAFRVVTHDTLAAADIASEKGVVSRGRLRDWAHSEIVRHDDADPKRSRWSRRDSDGVAVRAQVTTVVEHAALRAELTAESGRVLSSAEAKWALRRLWDRIAGPTRWDGPPIICFRVQSAFDSPLHYQPGDMPWIRLDRALPTGMTLGIDTVALPLPADDLDERPLVSEIGEGMLYFRADLVSFCFLMLSRAEEIGFSFRDRHDRMRATDSLPARQGFLFRPVIDEWALVLRAWVCSRRPGWKAKSPTYRVVPTHDVDSIRQYGSLRDVVRQSIYTARGVGGMRSAVAEFLRGLIVRSGACQDPHLAGIRRLMDASEQHGLQSTFYLMTAKPSPFDAGHDLASARNRVLVREIRERGHEIGLHPGYYTYRDPLLLSQELEQLESITGERCTKARQHILRFAVPETWRHYAQVGLERDSSIGFADRAGFRAGTCIEYPAWDLTTSQELNVVESPLIAMDATFRRPAYMNATATETAKWFSLLSQRCRNVGGDFVFLWHNSSFDGAYAAWSDGYEDMLYSAVTGY